MMGERFWNGIGILATVGAGVFAIAWGLTH